jgi:transcriptional regulator with XRE-family HTH domain
MASFGENLRRERELRGVDLHEMAEATKISIRFLQALEQDRVDVLPGGIFPRAFVRQYGKYLGLDPERLVAEFVFAFGGDPVPARAPNQEVHLDRSNRWWMIGAAALLVLAFLAWKTWGRSSSDAQAEAPIASAPPLTFPQDRVYPPPSPAGQAAAGIVVGLVVRKKSWVEAKVDGTTVLSRVMDEGETHRLDARDAVTLSLGNAGGVEYSLNGRPPASLGRDGEVRRNVVITAGGASAGSAGPLPIRASSPRPRRPSPSAVPLEESPAAEPSPSPSPGPAV